MDKPVKSAPEQAPVVAEETVGNTATPDNAGAWAVRFDEKGNPVYERGVGYETFDPIADLYQDPGVDAFDPGPEYTEHPFYSQFDFSWSSQYHMDNRDILRTSGYIPVREALGNRVRVKDGVASRGTMTLHMRPKEHSPVWDQKKREEQLRRQALSLAEEEAALEDNRRRAARDAGIDPDKIAVRDSGVQDERFAGGSTGDTDAFQMALEVAEARSRGRKSFGGFDGPMNKGAVPESPFKRGRNG